ncbi:hypothetical protein KWH52_16815, partial [Proteus mirabilis]|uniref:hypothetical protein n=1 Tax=Proteus mirabilis TaxID=584 RepID=UPI0021D03A4A
LVAFGGAAILRRPLHHLTPGISLLLQPFKTTSFSKRSQTDIIYVRHSFGVNYVYRINNAF